MLAKPFVSHILNDEALTRGLGDAEARLLVEWMVERAELLAETGDPEPVVWAELQQLCRRARSVSRFIVLWCYHGACGAAGQLAAAERFRWPLPTTAVDPCELLEMILDWEAGYVT